MEVQFPEELDVTFPSQCACCVKDTTDTRVSYRHTLAFGFGDPKAKTKKLSIPYCASCRDHVDWSKGGGVLGVFLSVLVNALLSGMAVGLLVLTWRMLSTWAYERETFTAVVGFAAVVAVVGFLARRRWSKRPRSELSHGHTRAGESVEIIGYRAGGAVKIRIHNPEWAELFSGVNPALFPAR